MNATLSEKRKELMIKCKYKLRDRSFILGICAMCETEENVQEMLNYMDANPSAISSDIIDKGMLIYYENEKNRQSKK